jgi:hypothetical protein
MTMQIAADAAAQHDPSGVESFSCRFRSVERKILVIQGCVSGRLH